MHTIFIKNKYMEIIYMASLVAPDIKESACISGDPGSISRPGKIPWRREWLLVPVFLCGEFHGQRSLAGYSSWGQKESETTE